MDPLLFARAQMGLSLGFHIAFAAVGVALPLLMVIADIRHLHTQDPDYLELSKRLAKGTSILFAVGAVSGTVLSFELGLLWPRFMETFGEVVGIAFSLEGFAFFTEAIFLGIYLYGRGRISPVFHLFAGVAVAVSGAASAFFVTLVNATMNLPAGFELAQGGVTRLDLWRALFPPSWAYQVPHVLISSYQATAFAMAGIHAWALLREPFSGFHRKALGVAVPVACLTALLQPISGDLSAGHVAREQPWKFAAMEAHYQTARGAALHIGGGVEIPRGLSLLAFHDPDAEVKGLDQFPRDQWAPVAKVHFAFQTMVGAGILMALLSALSAWVWWRKRALGRRMLLGWVLAAPLGLIALEAGWLVTEWGRQPWIVHGMMRTADAVTPFPNLAVPFWTFTIVYLLLGAAVLYLLRNQVRQTVAPRGNSDVP